MGYAEGTPVPWWVGIEPGDARMADRPMWMDEIDEILRVTGTDWEVLSVPAKVALPDGTDAVVPDRFGIIRATDNAVLGITGDRFARIQNRVPLELLAAMAPDARLAFETGGSLRGGKLVWYLARLPEEMMIAGDAHHTYVGVALGHDGNYAMKPFTTVVRIVCANTFRLAETRGNFIRVSHSGDIEEKARAAAQALGIVNRSAVAYQQLGNWLQTVELQAQAVREAERIMFPEPAHPDPRTATPGQLRALAATMTRREARVGAFRDILDEEIDRNGRTGWATLQAFTGWADHVKDSKVERFDSAVFGDGAAFKTRAMETVEAIAKDA